MSFQSKSKSIFYRKIGFTDTGTGAAKFFFFYFLPFFDDDDDDVDE